MHTLSLLLLQYKLCMYVYVCMFARSVPCTTPCAREHHTSHLSRRVSQSG